MLKELFPAHYQRYLSLLVLGPTLDELVKYLTEQGYSRKTIRVYIQTIPSIDQQLQQLKCYSINQITRAMLRTDIPLLSVSLSSHSKKMIITITKLLERYFDKKGIFPLPEPPHQIEKKLIDYHYYLQKVRGLAPVAIHYYCLIASQFLTRFNQCGGLT